KCRRRWSSKASGTWPAIFTGSARASKPRTVATPDLPAQRLAQFSRLPRPSALTMPMPVITVSVRCIVLPPEGRANRKGGDLVEQRGVREHVGVVPARDTDEALRLVGRREQPLAELEAHHLVTVAVRDQDGNRETPDAGERVEAGDEPERPEALVHVAEAREGRDRDHAGARAPARKEDRDRAAERLAEADDAPRRHADLPLALVGGEGGAVECLLARPPSAPAAAAVG